jgi:hypothetical protein
MIHYVVEDNDSIGAGAGTHVEPDLVVCEWTGIIC